MDASFVFGIMVGCLLGAVLVVISLDISERF